MSDAKTSEKRPVRIFEGNLREAEYARTVYNLTAKPGEAPEDYTQPESFAHVTRKLKAGDRIEITAEDNTWFAVVLMLTVQPLVRAELLEKHEFEADATKAYEGYEAKWAGRHAKWRVLRISDNTVMVEQLETKSEAVNWIETNAFKKAA